MKLKNVQEAFKLIRLFKIAIPLICGHNGERPIYIRNGIIFEPAHKIMVLIT